MIFRSRGKPVNYFRNYWNKKGVIHMSTLISVVLSLLLIMGSPGFLWAKTTPKVKKTVTPPPQSVQDLETATADLKENTKDLRHNITSWRKIQWDSQLPPAEKKQWREKADTYLQECEAYNELLAKVDVKKLPKSEVSRRFLAEKQTFQRELQFFRETLKMP